MPLSNPQAPAEEAAYGEPGADMTTNTGPRLPNDRIGRRLFWAIVISVLVNLALWRVASQVVRDHILAPPPPLTFRRIFLPRPKPKPHRKIVHKVVRPKPKPVVKPKLIVKPQPVIRRPVVRRPVVTPKPVAHPPPLPRPAPPAAHHHVLTAKGLTTAHHAAPGGGHAQLGKPIVRQYAGGGSDNNQAPTPHTQPTPQSQPEPQPQPQSAPQPSPQPPPQPKPPPQPTGPTQDATPSHQVYPDIPDELKTGDYQSFVRVKVEIAADDSFSVTLLTSSGDTDIDGRVLDALKRWKWKPALQNGQAVDSTQRFRFNFEVQ